MVVGCGWKAVRAKGPASLPVFPCPPDSLFHISGQRKELNNMSALPKFVYFEDDPLSRKVMELLLMRQGGYSDLTIFSESSEPIQKLRALPYKPNIIFMDIHMEPLNG